MAQLPAAEAAVAEPAAEPVKAADEFSEELLLVLSENWTLVPPRDLRGLVRLAAEAEESKIFKVSEAEVMV